MRHRLALIGYRLECLLELAFAKFLVVAVPFKYWSWLCGRSHCESLKTSIGKDKHRIISTQRAIRWAERYLPWKSVCLDKAVTAQRMLFRRGLPTTIYFGMRKDEKQQWKAHAWVRCQNEWVVGFSEEECFTVVGTYAKFCPAP